MLRNFSLGEFTHSDTARAKGISNTLPAGMEATALNTLEMMQRIRDHLSALKGRDVPIKITSGFRSQALNRAVGGVASSDHVAACAVDFKAPQFGTAMEVAKALAPYVDELHIGQLINEYPEKGSGGWVHVSTRKPTQVVNRIITISNKGTTSGINIA